MAISLPDRSYQSQWELRTEYIIAILGVGFALFLFGLNLFFGIKAPLKTVSENVQGITFENISEYAYWIYPFICIGRLVWVHFRPTSRVYTWLSALIDTIFLTVIIYAFSLKYQNPSASLLAPTFGFYYVIIALHAMRFNAQLVMVMGVSTILIWTVMLFSFVNQGAKITQSYEQYFSSSDVLIGSEIEKLIALALFSILLAIGVKRAKNLLSEAAEKQISDVKMIESEKSSRVKTEFLAAMSHELRTPLNGVLGMSEVLKTTDLTETQAGFVDIIEASGQDLLSIIEDILDYTQLEADQTTRHIAPFALNDITAKLDKKLRPKAEKKALDFRIITEGADNILLMGDEARLKRVLINLLDNAIKFTQNGYVLLHIKTTIVDTQSAALSVYVQDSGIGIAEENFEMIYEKFTQVDNSTTRQYGGAGLGLSISQNLVRAEGGEINLDSQLGRGSRFSFEIQLPYQAKQSDAPGKTLARPASITAPIVQIKARALILSEGDIGMQLKQQMTKMGLTAKCEADVNAALIDI